MAEPVPHSSGPPRWVTDDLPDKPVRQPLSRRRIVLAALALAESEGMAAITMRRVATTLEVTPMSLYNHVADKAELLDLMLDYVIGDLVRASANDTGSWEDRLRAVARRNHDLWKRHPVFAQVYVDGVTIGPYGLANIERIVGILRDAGFRDEDAAEAFFVLFHYSVASILVGPAKPVDPSRRDSRSDGTVDSIVDLYFSALPRTEIPNVVAAVPHMPRDAFEFGLELLIDGLRQRLAATTAEASETDSEKSP